MPADATTSSLEDALLADLTDLRARDLERRMRTVLSRTGATVQTDRGALVDFSSNDYLGLAGDPRLASAAAAAFATYGAGSTASRLIAGNTREHEQLEADLAEFFAADAAVTFSTGYAANTGTIPALVGRDDVIFADALNHASLIDGCRLSRAEVHVYPHADLDALETLLRQHRGTRRRALIVTDGMFSMDGDFADLETIVALAHAHDAWTYVDDAHAVGVVGADGRGSAELAGVLGEIDVLVGTLGKAFGAAGAFVLGAPALRALLVNRARSFVFSTGPMPAQAAAACAAIGIVRAEPARRSRVAANAVALREALAEHGIETAGERASHIVPVAVGDARRTMTVGGALAERGFLVGAVRPPTVPDGTSRLRITVSAAHDEQQIRGLASALASLLGQ